MSGFLQLSVKRRRKPDGFLDALTDEYRDCKANPTSIGYRLRQMVEEWLIEEQILASPASNHEIVTPFQIAGTIMKRICQISGHAWLEFTDHDVETINGATSESRKDINSSLAEFIPELEVNAIIEAFDSVNGYELSWDEVSNEHLIKLFSYLLDGSQAQGPSGTKSARTPAGAIAGIMNIASPDRLREYSESWFKDRSGAYVTPSWKLRFFGVPAEVIGYIYSGDRYSFTPEYHSNADNCVTWASRALDKISVNDWLETIRLECHIHADLVAERCEDYHIKDEGRMRCATWYAFEADKCRQAGLRSFL